MSCFDFENLFYILAIGDKIQKIQMMIPSNAHHLRPVLFTFNGKNCLLMFVALDVNQLDISSTCQW